MAEIDEFLKSLAWYDDHHLGWRIFHVSARFAHELHVTLLGAGMTFTISPQSALPVDRRTVNLVHSDERLGRRYDCYAIAPAPGLGGPYHWLVLIDGCYAGGDALGEQDAERKAKEFIEERTGVNETAGPGV